MVVSAYRTNPDTHSRHHAGRHAALTEDVFHDTDHAGTARHGARADGTLRDVRVYLGADHAGFELKIHLVQHLSEQGHDVTDVGPHAYDAADDYPPYCIEAARRVAEDEGSVGIVIGGSGNGEQIAANKVKGIRAGLGWSVDTAILTRQHNHAQVMGLGARMHTTEEAIAIVEAFLATPIDTDERHARRVEQLAEYEGTGTPPTLPS